MITAAPSIRRAGPSHVWSSYRTMVRFEIVALRSFLVMTLVIQTFMGAGMAVMYGFYLGEIPPLAQTWLVSGIPALSLFPLGFVLVPGVIADHRWEDTYDYIWSLPVPRLASAAATFTVFAGLSLPGMVVALGLAVWLYGVTLTPSLIFIPAVLLVAAMATAVGYAIGHAMKDPRMINLLTNMLVFMVLMFSPIIVPIEQFPSWFGALHRVLPFWHMANVLRDGLTTGLVEHVTASYLVLSAWLVGSVALASRIITRRA